MKMFIVCVVLNNIPTKQNVIDDIREKLKQAESAVGPVVSIKRPKYASSYNRMHKFEEDTVVVYVRLLDRSRTTALIQKANTWSNLHEGRKDEFGRPRILKIGAKPIDFQVARFDNGFEKHEEFSVEQYINEKYSRQYNIEYAKTIQAYIDKATGQAIDSAGPPISSINKRCNIHR